MYFFLSSRWNSWIMGCFLCSKVVFFPSTVGMQGPRSTEWAAGCHQKGQILLLWSEAGAVLQTWQLDECKLKIRAHLWQSLQCPLQDGHWTGQMSHSQTPGNKAFESQTGLSAFSFPLRLNRCLHLSVSDFLICTGVSHPCTDLCK